MEQLPNSTSYNNNGYVYQTPYYNYDEYGRWNNSTCQQTYDQYNQYNTNSYHQYNYNYDASCYNQTFNQYDETTSEASLSSTSSASSMSSPLTQTIINQNFNDISPISTSSSSPSSQQQSIAQTKRVATKQKVYQLPDEAVDVLNDWFQSHISHPYPSTDEKHKLAEQCGITVKQVNSWFCNRRNRSQNTKPKRIKRQLEQEISNVFNELICNPDKTQVIEKFRNTLLAHNNAF